MKPLHGSLFLLIPMGETLYRSPSLLSLYVKIVKSIHPSSFGGPFVDLALQVPKPFNIPTLIFERLKPLNDLKYYHLTRFSTSS